MWNIIMIYSRVQSKGKKRNTWVTSSLNCQKKYLTSTCKHLTPNLVFSDQGDLINGIIYFDLILHRAKGKNKIRVDLKI